jgi:hypothetical protein
VKPPKPSSNLHQLGRQESLYRLKTPPKILEKIALGQDPRGTTKGGTPDRLQEGIVIDLGPLLEEVDIDPGLLVDPHIVLLIEAVDIGVGLIILDLLMIEEKGLTTDLPLAPALLPQNLLKSRIPKKEIGVRYSVSN